MPAEPTATLRFVVDDAEVELHDVPPTTTLLQWLRASGRTGTKEGCAEGDCGACSVLIRDADGRVKVSNSCLVLLPQVDGLRVWTVQGLERGRALHPAQQAMVEHHGSQCGYCTPGFVMALAEASHRPELAEAPQEDWRLDDQVCGNLCRCTGYTPIRKALRQVAGTEPDDGIRPHRGRPTELPALDYRADGRRYVAPATMDEALAVLAAEPTTRVVCGATDLGLEVTQRHQHPALLLDLGRIGALRGIAAADGGFRIGAATALSELEAWSADALPVLHRMLRYFGSRQIKNRATVGGNLCNASPIGDLAPVLLALDATACIAGPAGERRVPLSEFFLGYRRTALQPGELLAAVQVQAPPPTARQAAYKVSRRRELDISAVSACFVVQLEQGAVSWARLAYGGVAATPVRALAAEQALLGAAWTAQAVEAAVAALPEQVRPIDDHRGTAWFRATLAANLLRGFFEETREQPFVPLLPRHAGTVQLPVVPEVKR